MDSILRSSKFLFHIEKEYPWAAMTTQTLFPESIREKKKSPALFAFILERKKRKSINIRQKIGKRQFFLVICLYT